MFKIKKILLASLITTALIGTPVFYKAWNNRSIENTIANIVVTESQYNNEKNGYSIQGYFIAKENISNAILEIDCLDFNENKVLTTYREIGNIRKGQRIDFNEFLPQIKNITNIAIPRIIY